MTATSPAGGEPAADDPADVAGAIRAAVLAHPDVADLSAGALGEIASYFSGKRVAGVQLDDDTVTVHVVARYGRPLPQIADELTATVASLAPGRAVTVQFSDVLLPGETLDETAQSGSQDE